LDTCQATLPVASQILRFDVINMPRKTPEQIRHEASQTFFKYYVKTPKAIKRYTNPLVKMAIKTEKKMGPYTQEGVAKANVWIDTNIKGNRAVRIAGRVASGLGGKKKEKKP
jgi:hypothetical protein